MPKPSIRLSKWLATLALLLSARCTLLTATPPGVEVASVELRGLGPFEQSLAVSLCVTNPNVAELAFQSVTVSLDIGGQPLADTTSDGAVILPPRSSTLVLFGVVTTVRNIGPQLLGVLQTGGLEYRIHGRVQLVGSLPLALPFSRSGRLDLLTTGGNLLADAAAPRGTRCTPPGL